MIYEYSDASSWRLEGKGVEKLKLISQGYVYVRRIYIIVFSRWSLTTTIRRNSASSLHFAARGKKFLTMRYKASQCCAIAVQNWRQFLTSSFGIVLHAPYISRIFVKNPTRPFDAIARRQKNINTSIRKFRVLVVRAHKCRVSEFCNQVALRHISNSLGLILNAAILACCFFFFKANASSQQRNKFNALV